MDGVLVAAVFVGWGYGRQREWRDGDIRDEV